MYTLFKEYQTKRLYINSRCSICLEKCSRCKYAAIKCQYKLPSVYRPSSSERRTPISLYSFRYLHICAASLANSMSTLIHIHTHSGTVHVSCESQFNPEFISKYAYAVFRHLQKHPHEQAILLLLNLGILVMHFQVCMVMHACANS